MALNGRLGQSQPSRRRREDSSAQWATEQTLEGKLRRHRDTAAPAASIQPGTKGDRRSFTGTREDQAVSCSSGAPVLAATLPRSKGLPTRTCYLTHLFLYFTILKITFPICAFLTLSMRGFIWKAFQLFLLFLGIGTFALEKCQIFLKAVASLKSRHTETWIVCTPFLLLAIRSSRIFWTGGHTLITNWKRMHVYFWNPFAYLAYMKCCGNTHARAPWEKDLYLHKPAHWSLGHSF